MVKECNKSVRHLKWALHGSWVHKMNILIHLWHQVSAFKTFSESLCVDRGDAPKVWCKVNLQCTLPSHFQHTLSAPLSVSGHVCQGLVLWGVQQGGCGVADEAAWQCGGRGTGARMDQRGSIPVGAEGPQGNLWAGTTFPEVLKWRKREREFMKAIIDRQQEYQPTPEHCFGGVGLTCCPKT